MDEFDEDQFISRDKEPLGRLLDDELAVKVQEAVSEFAALAEGSIGVI